MTVMASRITGQSSVCITLCLDWQQRNIKCPCCWSLVRGIQRWTVVSLSLQFLDHRWIPRTKDSNAEMFTFDDVIMRLKSIADCTTSTCNPALSLHFWPVSILHKTYKRKISEFLETTSLIFDLPNRFEIWQASLWHCCRDACQITTR